MEYKAISKKTMRSKDFKALRAKKPGYRRHIAITEDNTKEVLFRTPRGFFLQDCDRNLCNAGSSLLR